MADTAPEQPAGQSEKGNDAVERFLAMPPEHGVGDEVEAEDEDEDTHPSTDNRTFWQKLNHFLFEKQPSEYSSIVPRGPDGKRSKLFFFNGNGRGR